MKKNIMMRIASVVLVLTLMSTCAISGTFAKYVTTASGTDNARTAVWDIKAGDDFATQKMFAASYNAGMVASANGTDLVVAPGTNDSATYTLTGTPEVAYTVSFALDADPTDVTLKTGTYTFAAPYQDMSKSTDADYLPLKWTVTIASTSNNGKLADNSIFTLGTASSFNSLAEIKTALAKETMSFDANKACDVSVTIGWSWDFDATFNKEDTILGYYAKAVKDAAFTLPFKVGTGDTAADATANDGQAITTVAYDFSMTASQVTGSTTTTP